MTDQCKKNDKSQKRKDIQILTIGHDSVLCLILDTYWFNTVT